MRACVRACVCVHVRAVCVCSESMKDVTVNGKNNFGDKLDAMYNIACARSVSENVGLLLKNSYVVSDKFDLVLFLGNAFVPRWHAIAMDFWYSKGGRGVRTPWTHPLDPPMPSMLMWVTIEYANYSCIGTVLI